MTTTRCSGVARTATDDEIKRAYRALARQYHPDATPTIPTRGEASRRSTRAYETLRDPERRRRYDMFGEDGTAPRARRQLRTGEAFGLSDLFDAFFGGDPFGNGRGQAGAAARPDAEAVVDLDLAEAAFGTTADRRHPRCRSSASAATAPAASRAPTPTRCDVCDGTGEVRQVRRSLLGQIVTAGPCVACSATGSRIPTPCRECRGDGRVRGVAIDRGRGARRHRRRPTAAPRGPWPGCAPRRRARRPLRRGPGRAPTPRFERHGDDLVPRAPIAITQAALGTQLEVDTLDGPRSSTCRRAPSRATCSGSRAAACRRCAGAGAAICSCAIDVEVPDSLSAEEDELRAFSSPSSRGEEVAAAHDKGVFSRLRSAFQ